MTGSSRTVWSRLLGGVLLVSVGLSTAPVMAAPAAALLAPQPKGDIPPGLGLTPDGRSDQAQPTPSSDHSGLEQPVRLYWDKTPLSITLAVGKERLVSFPGAVRLGIPLSLLADLRTQTQKGTVYWLAQKPFAPTRVQVQDIPSGQYYLIDLAAVEVNAAATAPFNAPLRILNAPSEQATGAGEVGPDPLAPTPTAMAANGMPIGNNGMNAMAENGDGSADAGHSGTANRNSASESADYVTLTRYAAQQLYAPTRLLKTSHPLPSAHFEALPTDTLLRGGDLLAEPVAAWRKNKLYVTALTLTNRSAQPIDLDPRLLRGQWRTATFQHGRVGPSGSDTAMTALYLVSDRPFGEMAYVRE